MSFNVVNDITEYPGYPIATITKEPQIQVFKEEIHWFSPNYWFLSCKTTAEMNTEKKEDRKCNYCSFTAKSQNGLQNHIHRKHSLETPSGLACWTCRRQFTKKDLIDQHYKTVLHQINCRKLQEEEKSEMPPQTIQNIIQEHQEKREKQCKRSFKCSPIEEPGTSFTQKTKRRHETPFKYLRSDPAIIPFEKTMPQSDPRSEPIITWMDITDLELEENLIKTQKKQNNPDITDLLPTTEVTETTHEKAFREEILNLFNIPKEQVAITISSQEMLEELPILSLMENTASEEIPENFSFLEYLQDMNSL